MALAGTDVAAAGHRAGSHRQIIAPTICWSPSMVERGSRVLDVGCGDGELLQLLEEPRHRRPRHRIVARGRQPLRRQGTCGGAGRRRHRPRQLSGRCLRLRDPVADAAGDAPAEGRAGKSAAHRPARHRLVPEFRLLEDAAAASGRRPHAAHGKPAGDLVRHRQHPFLHHQGFRRSCATRSTSRWSARWRSISTAARCR